MGEFIIPPTGRFPLLEKPLQFPYSDIVNGAPEGPVFFLVDLIDYDGVVYLRQDHVEEMGRTVGMLTLAQANELRAENASLKAEVERLPETIGELNVGITNLLDSFNAGVVSRRDGIHLLGIETHHEDAGNESDDDSTDSDGQFDLDGLGLEELEGLAGQELSLAKREGTDSISTDSGNVTFGFSGAAG